jgi:hypothetical protein
VRIYGLHSSSSNYFYCSYTNFNGKTGYIATGGEVTTGRIDIRTTDKFYSCECLC